METSGPSDPSGKAIAVAASASLASKAGQPWGQMLVLAALAGAFIAFGSIAAMIAQANMGDGGAARLLSGVVFSVGLILVMIVGAQLFTGNTMMVLSIMTGELGVRNVIGAWVLVWLGNGIGALGVALLFAASGGLSDGVGEAAIALADGKLAKSSAAVFCSAILANMLVCLAVWISMGALTIPAKILAIVGPVTIFVAAGLEHSIANMSILPLGWLAEPVRDPSFAAIALNLAVSTLGNILGGAMLVFGIAFGHGVVGHDGSK